MAFDLENVQVGDKLLIARRFGFKCIETVQKVTPTGRVITKSGTFERNGRLRGEHAWDWTSARPATEEDVAEIYRVGLLSKIDTFRGWNKLSPDDLKTVSAIIHKHS